MKRTIGDSSHQKIFGVDVRPLISEGGLSFSRWLKKAGISEEQAASSGCEGEVLGKVRSPLPSGLAGCRPVTQGQPNC